MRPQEKPPLWTRMTSEAGIIGVELELVPTRTRVQGVDWTPLFVPEILAARPLDKNADYVLRSSVTRRGSYKLEWNRHLPEKTLVSVDLVYTGERPQVLYSSWLDSNGENIPDMGPSFDPVVQLLNELESFKDEDSESSDDLRREHDFLLELDKQTLNKYMSILGLDEAAISERLQAFHQVADYLNDRLRSTHAEVQLPDAPQGTGARLELFSNIFWDAAALRFEGGVLPAPFEKQHARRLGETLERFAAGFLRVEIPPLGPGGETTYHHEPDSYYVFMFAEFALACVENDPALEKAKNELLLPWMVRMQQLFSERFPVDGTGSKPYSSVMGYDSQPLTPLEGAKYTSMTGPQDPPDQDLRLAIKDNLHSLSGTFE